MLFLIKRHIFCCLQLSWRRFCLLLLVNILLESGKDLIDALGVHDFVVLGIWKFDRASLGYQWSEILRFNLLIRFAGGEQCP